MSEKTKSTRFEAVEDRFGGLFRNMTEGCALHEILTDKRGRAVDFRFLELNPAFERLTGLRREHVLGKRVTEVLSGIEPFWIETYGRVALTGEPASFVHYYPAPLDRWYQVYAYRPAPRQFVAIFMDITKRQEAEIALKQSESLLHTVIDTIPDGIYAKDAQSRLVLLNAAALKIVGKSADDLMGKDDRAIYTDPAVGEAIVENDRRVMAAGVPESFEEVLQTPEGYRYFLDTKAPWRDAAGNVIGIVGISRDITAAKQAADELSESRKKYLSLIETNNDFIWEMDAENRYTYCSPQMETLWGLKPADMIGKTPFDLMPEEHRESIRKRFAGLAESHLPFSGLESVARVAGGRLINIETNGVPFFDPDGRLLGYRGISRDITARKEAETARQKAEEKLEQILASIQDDFYVLDRNWRFIFTNRQFPARIGKEPEDFVGNRIWDMFPKHLGTELEENFRAAMDKREVRRFEIGGKYTNAWYRMTAFPSADGITVLGTDITEQKRIEQALIRNQERLKLAQASAGAGVWDWDIPAGTLEWSEEFFRLFGLDPRKHPANFETWRSVLHPDDRIAAEQKISEAVANRTALANEYRIVLPSGEVKWISALGNTVYGRNGEPLRMSGICFDATERKKAEALRDALAEQESLRLGAAVEQASEAVVMLDLDGTIRYVNAAFESMNKVPRDQAKGRSYLDVFAPSSAAAAVREILAGGSPRHGYITRKTADGRDIELEVAFSGITNPAGAVIGGLITEKDVTYEAALQRQVRQGQKLEALGTLAGGIAHDFNNILNPIFIGMELALLDPSLDQAIRNLLEVALKAAERGRDLVKQVIAFSRQKEKQRIPTKVGPVVKEAVNFLRVSIPSTIEIRADIRDESGCVLGDPAQIHQIVMNLSSNAAYAMRQKGGVLTVGLSRVEVDAALAAQTPGLKPGSYLRLKVDDSGTGMTPEVKEKIFDPFFTTKDPGSGSGMGMSVVDRIVKDYGGIIQVESEVDKGSSFSIYLPRVESEDPPFEKTDERPPKGTGRILLVDDEEVQVFSIRSMLQQLGYEVEAFIDAQNALSRFRSDPGIFDLVITDQTMPRLTGLQVAQELLRIRGDIPIILCTGFSETVDAEQARALGVREFLMKPYSIRKMAEVIQRVKTDTKKSSL